MKKDDLIPAVEGIQVFAQPIAEDDQWQVCIQNLRPDVLDQVMITATSYHANGEKATTTLRHQIDKLEPNEIRSIERLDPSLFALENEYWLSGWSGSVLLDYPFRFKPNQISPENQAISLAQ